MYILTYYQKFSSLTTNFLPPFSSRDVLCAQYGFNPRPPRKVGATRCWGQWWRVYRVSILAHLERWALQVTRVANGEGYEFQSSPTSKGRRYRPSRPSDPPQNGFNPRPPRKGALHLPTHSPSDPGLFQSSPTSKGGRYGAGLEVRQRVLNPFRHQRGFHWKSDRRGIPAVHPRTRGEHR